ncbi:phage capsid protein [Anaerotruncus sp. AF02-27]|uniref:major capsid protein n=1 Tax=Anaerotruncus sp. AF02-27 TaxID=2292191 RepID=UPI000E537BA9|nr:phage capsid protein [Anaerotruncus sp. AF02-27]RGX53777.1 phage capsid protein [Anaerotruncus sp. AF02-27]
MPITLAEAKVGMADKVDQLVVDEFRRNSLLLDTLTFDDCVSPGTGGSTMTYGYTRLKTPATAAFRALNSEYTAQEAKREKATADLKIFGGSAQLDRVLQNTSGAVNEMDFQLKQKVLGARNLFHYKVINGDATTHTDEFDGLDVMLTGSSTEFNTTTAIDLSTSAQLDSNYQTFLDMLDEFLSAFDGKPGMLMGNSKLITKIKAVARRAGYLTRSEDAFGRPVTGYDGIPLVDLGQYYNGTTSVDCVDIYQTGEASSAVTGLTDLYAASFALDGFHGVSPAGGKIIKSYLPDLSQPGAVKKIEVEMVAAVVLKNSRKAGVFRKIKVQ